MTPTEYWAKWAVALTMFLIAEYWVIRFAVIAAIKAAK
jgi:hypothetical protein